MTVGFPFGSGVGNRGAITCIEGHVSRSAVSQYRAEHSWALQVCEGVHVPCETLVLDLLVYEVPRYAEMARYVFDRLGWAGEQFEVYRCCLAYPIMPTTIVLRSAVPDLCVWVAWASTLAREQPRHIDTGKRTCPCHPVDLVGDAHPTLLPLPALRAQRSLR